MKAALYSQNGPALDVLVVGELPIPLVQAGEVIFELHTSGVNPSDVKSRLSRPVNFNFIVPHSDGAGVIVEAGAGVPRSRIGERVRIWNGQWQRAMGTAAEYIALPQDQAVKLHLGVGMEARACLGIPALTALHAPQCADEPQGAVHQSTQSVLPGVGIPISSRLKQYNGRGQGNAELLLASVRQSISALSVHS